MHDIPEKALRLVGILQAAVPFQVALTPNLMETLANNPEPVRAGPVETVTEVSYLGDAGGIMCRICPAGSERAVVVSLTHLNVSRKLPFGSAVRDYQKHRMKKLRQSFGIA